MKGNTTSPEAVTPMGVQAPGGTSSLSDDGPSVPVVCAEAAPDAASTEKNRRRLIAM
jgi:hypothetical protein